MSDQAKTMTEKQMREEKVRVFVACIKWSIYMAAHKFFWRFLFLTRLARPYSIAACKLGIYRKFPDGRCHWCGEIHR